MGITIRSIDDYYKEALEATKEQQTADVNRVNAMSEQQKKSVNDIYNAKINETDSAYEDDYRENAVQKLINEREVAENMANLGLTDSGLNRTQQTAVQLSYANAKGKIDRQKQAAVDALAQSLAVELANIETTRLSSVADIERQYSQNAMTNATNARNADIDYNAKLYEAEQEAATAKYEAEQKAITEQAKINAETTQKAAEKSAKQSSEYLNIISNISKGNNDDTLNKDEIKAQIFEFIKNYDLDIDFNGSTQKGTCSNSQIDIMLNMAGISKEEWRLYYLNMFGFKDKNQIISEVRQRSRENR